MISEIARVHLFLALVLSSTLATTLPASPASAKVFFYAINVDVVTRTVLRDRPFDWIGFAVDFVDEP